MNRTLPPLVTNAGSQSRQYSPDDLLVKRNSEQLASLLISQHNALVRSGHKDVGSACANSALVSLATYLTICAHANSKPISLAKAGFESWLWAGLEFSRELFGDVTIKERIISGRTNAA